MDGENTKVHLRFKKKDTSKKDLVTRAGRLRGRRYNQFSLQVESVYSDYLRVAILGNGKESQPGRSTKRQWEWSSHPVGAGKKKPT
jgi:hypothetical protein